MRRLRRFLPDEIYFVTIRTVEERFAIEPHAAPGAWNELEGRTLELSGIQSMLERGRACVEATEALIMAIRRAESDENILRPHISHNAFTNSIPNIIGSCMARGVQMFGVHLYGFVWMSNHGHLLLRAPLGNFAEFMAYLNGQIAVQVNRFLERKHQLWARRYAAAQVLDEAAELKMLEYILANPQRAGIANSIEEWHGLSSAAFFFQNLEQRFLCFDRTHWYTSGRPDDIAPFLSTVKLEHKLLPQLSRLDRENLRRKLCKLVKTQMDSLPTVDTIVVLNPTISIRRRFMARTVIPTDRPESSKRNPQKRSQQPLCHTTKQSLRIIYKKWYHEFRKAYANSSREYRFGNIDVVFPPGSFAPSKYPRARYSSDPDKRCELHPTRRNLQNADATLAA